MEFVFDELAPREEILNQKDAIKQVFDLVKSKKNLVLYGKRNRAKTSIIKNIIIPDFIKLSKNNLAVYVELMRVRDAEDLSERLTREFTMAYGKFSKVSKLFNDTLSFFKGLSPSYEISPTGDQSISFKADNGSSVIQYIDLLERISKLATKKGLRVLLCFDEFQDIALSKDGPQLESNLRRLFESSPSDMSILISGSKQHLLADMFESPNAPFFKFGMRVALKEIAYDEYISYIRDRLKGKRKKTPDDTLKYLQDKLFRSPEEIHRIGYTANSGPDRPLKDSDIDSFVERYLEGASDSLETRISQLNDSQYIVLKLIAFSQNNNLAEPFAKDNLKKSGKSQNAIAKALSQLLDYGFIEKTKKGYQMSDPFLYYYIRKSRVALT